MAQALHQPFHHGIGHGGVFRQAARELHPPQNQDVGLHLGSHGCGMRLVVNQTHLAHVVARVHGGQDHFTTAAIGGHHTGAAGEHDGQAIGLLPLLDDALSAFEAPLDHGIGHRFGLGLGQGGKQGNPADQIEIGQERHACIPCSGKRLQRRFIQ
ncbi:hypothetical protein D9M69_535770 [compost metagenome]